MNRRGLPTIACACFWLACGPVDFSRSEFSWSECRDGVDNDSDGLIDCLDPDCRAVPCVEADAGNDATLPDAQIDGMIEACDPACIPGEVCRDQQCEIPLPATVRIEVLSVDGPSVTGTLFPRCADESNTDDCGLNREFQLVCTGCPPDPYVRVDLEMVLPDRASQIQNIGRTRAVMNTESASWVDADRWETNPGPVQLAVGDEILLTANDSDAPGDRFSDLPPDDLLFACSFKATELRMGSQRCISRPSSNAQSTKSEFSIWIEVRQP